MMRIAQNVGENRGMCREMIAFCEGLGAKVYILEPCGTKIHPDIFKDATGYKKRTSEHARDAWVIANRTLGLARQDEMMFMEE